MVTVERAHSSYIVSGLVALCVVHRKKQNESLIFQSTRLPVYTRNVYIRHIVYYRLKIHGAWEQKKTSSTFIWT